MEVVSLVTVGCNKHEYLLSSTSHEEYSDDEISTKKEMHWRLGPENHDDTVLYDFEMACDAQEEILVAVEFITHDALSRSISHEEYSDDEISTKKAMHWRLGPADHYDTIPYTGNLNRSVAVRFDFDNTVLYDFDMDRDTQEEMVKSADEVSCRTHRFRFCSLDRPSIG
ncbi:uncharacterized protein LOC110524865 [Oncorhynchus mykiss]|uniref:uncharacterized protein LOC110524865 n=1 Tax=Oncorhynchus mykiss TaxID=8022 RepID=UPI000B4F1973|nr:uncharacterized protein LOC110524865 [Oncorhynchus mykiss]